MPQVWPQHKFEWENVKKKKRKKKLPMKHHNLKLDEVEKFKRERTLKIVLWKTIEKSIGNEGYEWPLAINVRNHINEFTYRTWLVSDSNAFEKCESRSLIKAQIRDTVRMSFAFSLFLFSSPPSFMVMTFLRTFLIGSKKKLCFLVEKENESKTWLAGDE